MPLTPSEPEDVNSRNSSDKNPADDGSGGNCNQDNQQTVTYDNVTTTTYVDRTGPKKVKTPKKLQAGFNSGTYTGDEEKRFLEGLEFYGRDWKKVSDPPWNGVDWGEDAEEKDGW